jgi:hypothetical protein
MRGEDFHLATSEDLNLATHEDFLMATDNGFESCREHHTAGGTTLWAVSAVQAPSSGGG